VIKARPYLRRIWILPAVLHCFLNYSVFLLLCKWLRYTQFFLVLRLHSLPSTMNTGMKHSVLALQSMAV
jgi:hypothetical protein